MTADPETTGLGASGEFCWMDIKTRDIPATADFFSFVLDWRFAVDETDWRRATKIRCGGHWIGSVSDLATPIYPPGLPAHVAFYLSVDDVDRRMAQAAAHGAQLVLAPFGVAGQGRMSTLLDPFGAAFSLWQPGEFTGWRFPPGLPGGPHRMVLVCEHPDQAEHFYRHALGVPVRHAGFLPPTAGAAPTPQWELVIGVPDLEAVATRARRHGGDVVAWSLRAGRTAMRLSSTEGLTFHVTAAADRPGLVLPTRI